MSSQANGNDYNNLKTKFENYYKEKYIDQDDGTEQFKPQMQQIMGEVKKDILHRMNINKKKGNSASLDIEWFLLEYYSDFKIIIRAVIVVVLIINKL